MKIHTVEQRSPEWYALRAGVPTASEFSSLVTSKGEPSKSMNGYAMQLAAEKYAGKTMEAWSGNSWTDRGKELEPEAIRFYEFDRDIDVEQVGFVTDDEGTMGCSPDGLVGSAGMIEIKILKAENHIKTILYFQKHGHCPADYVQQTQGQLLIAEREWCDLVFYHPDLPKLVIRQKPDDFLHQALLREIRAVNRERDNILAALRAQQMSKPFTGTVGRADLATSQPVF